MQDLNVSHASRRVLGIATLNITLFVLKKIFEAMARQGAPKNSIPRVLKATLKKIILLRLRLLSLSIASYKFN